MQVLESELTESDQERISQKEMMKRARLEGGERAEICKRR